MARPTEYDHLTFYGKSLTAVKLPDGRIAAGFNDLCNAIGLSMSAQLRRVRADDTIGEQLLTILIDEDGTGERPVNVLTAWAIPFWLSGIRANMVDPAKRDAIRAFKKEAADALYNHFSQSQQVALQSPTTLVPSQPIEQPSAPAQGAPPDIWIQYYQQMIAFLEWQQDIETWRGDIESRMESVEEMGRLLPEILERMGPAPLSPEHQRSVQALAGRLNDLLKAAHNTSKDQHAAIYGELKDAFHVGTYKEIPESQWSEVARWFQSRIAKAEKR